MIKHRFILRHDNRTTKAEVWLPAALQVGWFVDHNGVRYRVTSIVVKTTTIHAFLRRLEKQPKLRE